MARNVRQKYPRAPAKATKRRGSDTSSSFNLSDDDSGYSAIEDLSESDEDDEDHVFAAEQEHIISLATKKGHAPARPIEEEEEAEDADEEEVADEADEPDEEEDDDGDAEEDGQSVSWEGLSSDAATPQAVENYISGQHAPIERHVRFTGVPDSDTDSTTSDPEDVGNFFPDIFVDQNSLDPAFRRELEKDDDSSGSGSFWDFHSSQDPWAGSDDDATADAGFDDATPTATPVASAAPTAASSPVKFPDFTPFEASEPDMDGYETDGDTTEEDIPEPIARKKQPRRNDPTPATSDSDTGRPRRHRGQPRVGRFNLDPERKPIAVMNPVTRKMMIFTTPQKHRQFDLAPESFNIDFMTHPGVTQSSPILNDPAHLMMSAMVSNTFGDFMNTQSFGPPEAFFPVSASAPAFDSEDDLFEVEDEEEKVLELDDFITFNHHDSSDNENENEKEEGDWNNEADPSKPETPNRSRKSSTAEGGTSEVHPLLSHFDNNSDIVGAFRRDQINRQLVLSDKVSQESLAFSGPYHYGVLRGVKRQSMEAVTTPITPVRRQKRKTGHIGTAPPRMNSFTTFHNVTTSPLYDLSQKRTASGELESERFKRVCRPTCDMEQW